MIYAIIELICYQYDCICRILCEKLCNVFFSSGLFWLLTGMRSTADRPKLQTSGAATTRSSAVKISLIFQLLDKYLISKVQFLSRLHFENHWLRCVTEEFRCWFLCQQSSSEMHITEFLQLR